MFANFATAISTSTAVTLALFYLMNLLVSIQPQALVEPRERMDLKWVRVADPEPPPRTIDDIPKRETFEPPQTPTTPSGDPGERITVSKPKVTATPIDDFSGTGLQMQDGPLVALVRVSPTYPARAQQAGLEGWVLVKFDVLANGTVSNVTIVESSHSMFEKAARRAAERFRYKAKVVDGVPVGTTGMQNLFTFRMED
jgi:protein TonB